MKRLALIILATVVGSCGVPATVGPTPFGRPPQQITRPPAHPTATPPSTPTQVPTMTPVATGISPYPGQYHVYALPAADVCDRDVLGAIEDAYIAAHARVDGLAFDLRTDSGRFASRDYQDMLRRLEVEAAGLPEPDCARTAKAALREELRSIGAAFQVYPSSPDAAASALVNAWAWSNVAFYWIVGNQSWRPIPLH